MLVNRIKEQVSYKYVQATTSGSKPVIQKQLRNTQKKKKTTLEQYKSTSKKYLVILSLHDL